MTGPSCASMTRRVAMTSSANDNVGIWTMLTWWPSRVRMLCTPSQPEPSTQPPWTRTTFKPFVFFIRFLLRYTPCASGTQVGNQEFLNNMPACSGMLTGRNNVPHTGWAPLGVDELPPSLWHFDRPVFARGLLCWRSVDQEMAPLFEAPKRQETSGGAAEHPVRRQLAKYRDALRG